MTTRRIHTRFRSLRLIVIPLQIIRHLITFHYSSMALLNTEQDTVDGTTLNNPSHQHHPAHNNDQESITRYSSPLLTDPSQSPPCDHPNPRPTYQYAYPRAPGQRSTRTKGVLISGRFVIIREIKAAMPEPDDPGRSRCTQPQSGALSSSPAGRGRRTGCSRGTTAAAATCRSRRGTSPTAAPRPGQGAR